MDRRSRSVDDRVQGQVVLGPAPVKGRFTEFSGDGQITETQTVFGRVDIKAASLDTGIRKRDEHLRSAEFFEVEKFPDISVVVTSAEAIDGDTVDLRAQLTVKRHHRTAAPAGQGDGARRRRGAAGRAGHHRPPGLRRRRQHDGHDRRQARRFPATSCSGERRASIWRMAQPSEPSRPLRILVYSDNPRTREQVQLALGKRVHPDLPELTYVDVATGPMVIRQMDEGGFDLVDPGRGGDADRRHGDRQTAQGRDRRLPADPGADRTARRRLAGQLVARRGRGSPPDRPDPFGRRGGVAAARARAVASTHELACRTCLFEARRHGRGVLVAILTKKCGVHSKAR